MLIKKSHVCILDSKLIMLPTIQLTDTALYDTVTLSLSFSTYLIIPTFQWPAISLKDMNVKRSAKIIQLFRNIKDTGD